MKKKERKVLQGKLLTAINKVLKDNKDELKKKTVRAINKSIRQIAKKTDKKENLDKRVRIVAAKSKPAKATTGR
jgi:hypothetical protein